MSDERLTPSELCALAGCEYGALAAWRIRLGFLPRTSGAPQQRYTFGEAVAARLMAILTGHGVTASEAVKIVESIRNKVDLDRFGEGLIVAVGREPNRELVAEAFMFPNSGSLDFVGDVVIVIRLASVAWRLFQDLCRLRGIAPRIEFAGAA